MMETSEIKRLENETAEKGGESSSLIESPESSAPVSEEAVDDNDSDDHGRFVVVGEMMTFAPSSTEANNEISNKLSSVSNIIHSNMSGTSGLLESSHTLSFQENTNKSAGSRGGQLSGDENENNTETDSVFSKTSKLSSSLHKNSADQHIFSKDKDLAAVNKGLEQKDINDQPSSDNFENISNRHADSSALSPLSLPAEAENDEMPLAENNKENENNPAVVVETLEPMASPVVRNSEANESSSQNNSEDENALVIDDQREKPPDTESPLPGTDEPGKQSGSSVKMAVKTSAKTAGKKRTGTPRQTLPFDKEDLEHLRLPEKHGWKRELVYRGTYDGGSRKMDVYYHPPTGRKLRSMMDIGAYLDKQENYPLNRTHFTFRKEKLFDPPFELVRSAGQPVKAFNSPNTVPKDRSSPSTNVTQASARKVNKVASSSKSPQVTPGSRVSVVRAAQNSKKKRDESVLSEQHRNSPTSKTNGIGPNLPPATQQSPPVSNQSGMPSAPHAASIQANRNSNKDPNGQSQAKTVIGFGSKNKVATKSIRPAASWKMKVTPRVKYTKKVRSPDWRPSSEDSSSEGSESEQNVEIIRHGVVDGDADGDDMQRVMGPASDLIASIVRPNEVQPQSSASSSTSISVLSNSPGNTRFLSRPATGSLQPPRVGLPTSLEPRLIIVSNLRQRFLSTNIPPQSINMIGQPVLHPRTSTSNLPVQILPKGLFGAPTSISDTSTLSNIFPPPPPLASRPTFATLGLPPLRTMTSIAPQFVSRVPPPLVAAPRRPPALQPCPSLLETIRPSAPKQIILDIPPGLQQSHQAQPTSTPPLQSGRPFAPNIPLQHGSQKSQEMPVLASALATDSDIIKGNDLNLEGNEQGVRGKDQLQCQEKTDEPEVIRDSSDSSVSSDDEVQIVAKSDKDLTSAETGLLHRKRQAPSESSFSDTEDAHKAKCARLEDQKSVKSAVGKEQGTHLQGTVLPSTKSVLSNMLRKKNITPATTDSNKENDLDVYDDDDDEEEEEDEDEFLPPVSFAPEASLAPKSQNEQSDGSPQCVSTTRAEATADRNSAVTSNLLSQTTQSTVAICSTSISVNTNSSNAQLLTLPPSLREKLDLSQPLLLTLNGKEIEIPVSHVLDTKDSLKVLLPPGMSTPVSGSSQTLSVSVSNVAPPPSSPPPKLTKSTHLLLSFKRLQDCVGIMTNIFKFFSLPSLLRLSQVNKAWLRMFYQPSLWQTVNFRSVYVKDWDQASKFLQRVCVKKLNLSGMVLRRDIESESWQRIQRMVPVITTLTELQFGRVPSNVIEGLMEKLPQTVNISADFIIDTIPNSYKDRVSQSRWAERHVDNMASALTSVGLGMSPADAARKFNVAESDLLHLRQDRMYVLTPEEESLVVLCCTRLAQMGFSITISSFLIKCQEMFARRYSTSVPVPIFDGACSQLYQRNSPFFFGELSQNPGQSLSLKLDRHYAKLGNLYDNICRPKKMTAEQVYMFDMQAFRLMSDTQVGARRGSVTCTLMWATDASSLSVRPTMLVTPVALTPEQSHENIHSVVAKNGVATPTHVQQYFRELITSAIKFPIVVLCHTDASNFSESMVSMCFQHQVYLMNTHVDIAKYVFPGCQGGLLHMLKKQVPSMSMTRDGFLSRLKLLLEKCVLNIHMSTKLAFTATGIFPVNRKAPLQYRSKSMSELMSQNSSASANISSAKTESQLQASETDSKESKQPGSSTVSEYSDDNDNNLGGEDSDSGSGSDIELIEEPSNSNRVSVRPSTLVQTTKPSAANVNKISETSPPEKSTGDSGKVGKEGFSAEENKKENKHGKGRKTKHSKLYVLASKLLSIAKRGPIKHSSNKYKPLKPLKPAQLLKDQVPVIKKTVNGTNVISILPLSASLISSESFSKSLTSVSLDQKNVDPQSKSVAKGLESNLPPLAIEDKKNNSMPSKEPVEKSALTLSPSKYKALVRKHIQEAIEAVVEESREYARQVERGGVHGDEIMPEKWMQRQRERQAAQANSSTLKKVGGTSIVLKTSCFGESSAQKDEEEDSEEEEEENVDEDEEVEATSSEEEEEDEAEVGVEWTVSTQPKHKETEKSSEKRHKKKKKKSHDSDEEATITKKSKKSKKKKSKKSKKKKHKKRRSRSEAEEIDTSQETSPQKQVEGKDIDDCQREVAVNNGCRLASLANEMKSSSPITENEQSKVNNDALSRKFEVPAQPSHIVDHDYFSKFVDEDSALMIAEEEKPKSDPQILEDSNQAVRESDKLGSGEVVKPQEGSVRVFSSASNEHMYSKAAEVEVEEAMDTSSQDVEIETEEAQSSPTKGMEDDESSDSSSDSESETDTGNGNGRERSEGDSSGSGQGSNSSSSSEESSDAESESVETEQSRKSVSWRKSSSPRKKRGKDASSSDESASASSNSSESESEEDGEKNATASYESDDDEEEEAEEDKCQLCMRSAPPHSSDVLIDWVDCDKNCGRWFHVICIKNSKFRSGSKSKNPRHYICPSCR